MAEKSLIEVGGKTNTENRNHFGLKIMKNTPVPVMR
jgi:hypothetical protein